MARSRSARILFLEFVVVLSGVFAGQFLQDHLAERAERARAQRQIENIFGALHNSAETAELRLRSRVCMLDAIERVRDALAMPQPDQSALRWVRVPEQMPLDDTGIDAARPLLIKYFDNTRMMTLASVEAMQANLQAGQDDELAAWQVLSLLHPRNGAVEAGLRPRLKLALAEAERTNRLLIESSGIVAGQSRSMQVPVHANTIASFAKSPKLCASMAAYSRETHDKALATGRMPDGRPVHPRVLVDLGIEAPRDPGSDPVD